MWQAGRHNHLPTHTHRLPPPTHTHLPNHATQHAHLTPTAPPPRSGCASVTGDALPPWKMSNGRAPATAPDPQVGSRAPQRLSARNVRAGSTVRAKLRCARDGRCTSMPPQALHAARIPAGSRISPGSHQRPTRSHQDPNSPIMLGSQHSRSVLVVGRATTRSTLTCARSARKVGGRARRRERRRGLRQPRCVGPRRGGESPQKGRTCCRWLLLIAANCCQLLPNAANCCQLLLIREL